MKLHRFFVNPVGFSGKEIISTDKEIIGQIKRVLRLRVGDKVIFLDGSGKEYVSEIAEMNDSEVRVVIVDSGENKNEPELKITLCQALCKKDKFEWVLQKGTEIGISEFVPIITERTEKLGTNRERLEKVLKEAAEQSERGIIPKLHEAQTLKESFLSLSKDSHSILLNHSGDPIARLSLAVGRKLSVFVGPEGGWTEAELDLAKKSGAKIISLGKTVLRAETAGLVAAAILLNK